MPWQSLRVLTAARAAVCLQVHLCTSGTATGAQIRGTQCNRLALPLTGSHNLQVAPLRGPAMVLHI